MKLAEVFLANFFFRPTDLDLWHTGLHTFRVNAFIYLWLPSVAASELVCLTGHIGTPGLILIKYFFFIIFLFLFTYIKQ